MQWLLLLQWERKESRNKHLSSSVHAVNGQFIYLHTYTHAHVILCPICVQLFLYWLRTRWTWRRRFYCKKRHRSFIAIIYLISYVSMIVLIVRSFIHSLVLHVIDFCPFCRIHLRSSWYSSVFSIGYSFHYSSCTHRTHSMIVNYSAYFSFWLVVCKLCSRSIFVIFLLYLSISFSFFLSIMQSITG